VPAEPVLSKEERTQFLAGVRLFNAGLYFECHDVLEEMWSGVRGDGRDFFQGLIQVAVAFYHLSGGNAEGARSMLGRALKRLAPYPERYFGFELGAHRAELLEWLRRLEAGEAPLDSRPRWSFDLG
jgi:predicted metal-dependent hydrolase